MLNPEVRKIYPANTVKELECFAENMEQQGRKVRLGLPANRVPGQVFPQFVGIENFQDDEFDTFLQVLHSIYENLTEGRPFFEDEMETMSPGRYTTVCRLPESVDLWVK